MIREQVSRSAPRRWQATYARKDRTHQDRRRFLYDTFVTRFEDKIIEAAYVTFGLDADGRVERITMKPVSPLADFSYDYVDLLFTPVAGAGR